jgi:hypothetical protein
MAFVCILDNEDAFYEVARRGSSHLVTINVGYDDAEERSYSAMVALDRMAGGEWELTFCLSEYDAETDGIHDFFRERDVAGFIAKNDRTLILVHVIRAIHDLLHSVQPDRVYMCTFEADLPEPAMLKYDSIEEMFRVCHYAVHRQPDHHGQRIWWMERRAPAIVDGLNT